MLFLSGIALAILVGFLAGGKIERIGELRLTWMWVAPIAFALQLLVVYGPEPFSSQLAIDQRQAGGVGGHAAPVQRRCEVVALTGAAARHFPTVCESARSQLHGKAPFWRPPREPPAEH